MIELVASFTTLLAFVIAAFFFMLIGLSRSQPFPQCDRCKSPMPDGYWAYIEGEGCICERCGYKYKILPWYAKTLPNGKVLGKYWED